MPTDRDGSPGACICNRARRSSGSGRVPTAKDQHSDVDFLYRVFDAAKGAPSVSIAARLPARKWRGAMSFRRTESSLASLVARLDGSRAKIFAPAPQYKTW